MKSAFIALLACVAAQTLPKHPTYENTNGVQVLCGYCKDGAQCDKEGKCADGCLDGWTGNDCRTAQCDIDCGADGVCVKPDKCVCGYLYANGEDGGCYSLRGDGIKGAFCALAVVISAISICGGLQTYLTKKQKPE